MKRTTANGRAGKRGAEVAVGQPTPVGDATSRTLLVVSGNEATRTRVRTAAEIMGYAPRLAVDVAEAELELSGLELPGLGVPVLLIDAGLGSGAMDLAETIALSEAAPVVMLLDAAPTLERAVWAMRAGVRDVVDPNSGAELERCLKRAGELTTEGRASVEREKQMEQLCGKLTSTHEEVSEQLGLIAGDLADAYSGLRSQVADLTLASELNGVLRQELDVESLLRTLLEFLLAKVGSTNAGVFLPTNSGDYSLGAYINYDVPKASAEVMLDQLACELAPRFEGQETVRRLEGASAMHEALGDEAHWLEGHTAMVIACHEAPHGDQNIIDETESAAGESASDRECLAVLCLFRDRRVPFPASASTTLQIAADLFGKQLARVIRVHHRASPDEQSGLGDLGWAA